ncbi:hypothetical protein C8R47DRAFT_1212126 [Mycena vitilis]|nr:hypothetical protein C8R47DRAFT_1212126 [Mycena vitilis]
MRSLGTQLVRSAHAALEVRYQEHDDIDPSTVNLLLEQCHRWGSLHLAISPSRSPTLSTLSAWAHHSNPFPRLETLNIIAFSQADHREIENIFEKAPRLRKVILTDKAFQNISPTIAIPWGQITHYRGTSTFTHQHQLKFLNMASNLVECTIGLAVQMAVPTCEQDIITLPRLRRLYLHEPELLRYLRTPLLADFVGVEGWHFASVPSAVALKRLTLLQGRTLGGPIADLYNLRFLEYLFIGPERTLYNTPDLPVEGRYCDVLTIRDPARVVCPNLTSLVLGFEKDLPLESFFTMARSRFRADNLGRLKSLRIFLQPHFATDTDKAAVQAGIDGLCDEGFDAALLRCDDPWIAWAKTDFF